MNLFIKLKDGKPYEHPVCYENMQAAFPNFNFENLPNDWATFEQTPLPSIGVYEVYDGFFYSIQNGVVKQIHKVRPMTVEEKIEKQTQVKKNFELLGLKSWKFNEEICDFDPPIPYPSNGKKYYWEESDLAWIEKTNIMGVDRV